MQETEQHPISQVLDWADAFRDRFGRWPTAKSGPVAGAPGATWRTIHSALLERFEAVRGNATLPRLLARARDAVQATDHPLLTIPEIVRWANAFHDRHGKWPRDNSGPIPGTPGETWRQLHEALRDGKYGLPGGTTLARLIEVERQRRFARDLRPFTALGILAWADAHHARMGRWPTFLSGPIPEAPGETWTSVEHALRRARRGARGGSSLARFLTVSRHPQPRVPPRDLTINGIVSEAG